MDGNRGMGTAYFFLARQAHKVTEPSTDELEEQHLVQLQQYEIETALLQGEFKVLSWAAIFVIALLRPQSDAE